jgi:hypothetical protein
MPWFDLCGKGRLNEGCCGVWLMKLPSGAAERMVDARGLVRLY